MFAKRFISDCRYSKRKDPPNRRQAKRKEPIPEGFRDRLFATGSFRLARRRKKPTSPYFSPMLSMMVRTRPSTLFSVVRYGAMRSV